MSTYKYIDITGVDLMKFVKDVYDLSIPQGMGWLHAKGGALSDADAAEIVELGKARGVSMDYVHGRACKMHVNLRNGKMLINDRWYDHSDHRLEELLRRNGIDRAARTIEIDSEAA